MELVKTLWMNNIWPSILSGAITLVVVLIVMQLFSIRGSSLSSNLRFKLLELPVIKSFLVLLGLNLGGLKISWYTVLFIYSWGVICFVQRWISYEKFKTDVLLADRLDNDSTRALQAMVEQIAGKADCKVPKLLVVDREYPSPFVLGFFNPLLVVPQSLLPHLSDEELEALLAHEIAHMARWDNLYVWQAVLFRDIMFFNPVVIFIYNYLLKEKEKNCDDLAISITGRPAVFAEMLLKVYNLMQQNARSRNILANTIMQSLVGPSSLFTERVERIVKLPQDYFAISRQRQFLYYVKVCFLIFVTVMLFSVNLVG
jgi:Zn-dependent protease with chaperone function